ALQGPCTEARRPAPRGPLAGVRPDAGVDERASDATPAEDGVCGYGVIPGGDGRAVGQGRGEIPNVLREPVVRERERRDERDQPGGSLRRVYPGNDERHAAHGPDKEFLRDFRDDGGV